MNSGGLQTSFRCKAFAVDSGVPQRLAAYVPGGIAIGDDGSMYVGHYDAGRISRYSAVGEDLGVFATYAGCANGCGTDFIKFGPDGNLYVGDFQPVPRVRLISPSGDD